MGDALGDVALFQFRQVETGGEMLALAGEQHRADAVRQRGEELLDADDRLVVERVAFLRPIELQHGDAAVPLGGKRGGQMRGKDLRRHSLAHGV